MAEVLPDDLARFVRAAGPEPDETLIEMDEYAVSNEFPHVGADVGATLGLLARLTDARRAFEFGSGFGYSAYWIADALPADGEVVLTDVDGERLDLAREYLERGGNGDRARYELGDALETARNESGPVDLVLIDHEKDCYREAFELIEPVVPTGGVVVADNAMSASIVDFDALLAHVEGEAVTMDDQTAGIADYLDAVRSHPDFETIVLPLGEGIAVSYRHAQSGHQ